MRIALVNPFDPLPGEGSRPGRYESLCGALVSRGHEITWYSSDFSHAFKRRRDAATIAAAARRQGLAVVLLPTRAYRQNVSLGRLRSHALLARASACRWVESRPPELVVASAPPPGLVWQAAQWARRTRAKFVLDVQDLWPETFRRFWPRGLGWLHGLIFGGAARAASAACHREPAMTSRESRSGR